MVGRDGGRGVRGGEGVELWRKGYGGGGRCSDGG